MCNYKLHINPEDPKLRAEYPSYNGDRIIVNKFAYDLSDPKRWDVVVFKYPEDAQVNYIKRLVGLPNEQFRVVHGDIYTAPSDSQNFEHDGKIAQVAGETPRDVATSVRQRLRGAEDDRRRHSAALASLGRARRSDAVGTGADYKSFKSDEFAAADGMDSLSKHCSDFRIQLPIGRMSLPYDKRQLRL